MWDLLRDPPGLFSPRLACEFVLGPLKVPESGEIQDWLPFDLFDYNDAADFAGMSGNDEEYTEFLDQHSSVDAEVQTATDGSVIDGVGTCAYLLFQEGERATSTIHGGGKEDLL